MSQIEELSKEELREELRRRDDRDDILLDHLARFLVAGLLVAFRGQSPLVAAEDSDRLWKATRDEWPEPIG